MSNGIKRQLTIVSGAGINLGISAACPQADEMLGFTYQKISKSVYSKVSDEIKSMFSPDSFDYILGGLLTVNLAIEKTKQDLKRFDMDEDAFSQLFKQSDIQSSIFNALSQIEEHLTISLKQMMGVVETFSPAIERLIADYDSINYFTVNFDRIFDHIILGAKYRRGGMCTDFWNSRGKLDKSANKKMKIFHLHGDLLYKPNKQTKYSENESRWPVLVVGDNAVKRGIIASNPALSFYNTRLKEACEDKGDYTENNLAIIGFGFRNEDQHIIHNIRQAIKANVFDNISLYDPSDKLEGICNGHHWTKADTSSLTSFLEGL